jgi:hypothetical protein
MTSGAFKDRALHISYLRIYWSACFSFMIVALKDSFLSFFPRERQRGRGAIKVYLFQQAWFILSYHWSDERSIQIRTSRICLRGKEATSYKALFFIAVRVDRRYHCSVAQVIKQERWPNLADVISDSRLTVRAVPRWIKWWSAIYRYCRDERNAIS